jgi:hypothetical protein
LSLIKGFFQGLYATFLLLILLSASVRSETGTVTQTSSLVSTRQPGDFFYSMVPVDVPGAPTYPRGNGTAGIQVEGTMLALHMQAFHLAPGAHFRLILAVNGTTRSLSNMTADAEGEVESEASVTLSPGKYELGLRLLDTTTFWTPTQVMASNPPTLQVTLVQAPLTTTQTTEGTESVRTIEGNRTDDDGVRSAIQTGVIPAVVQVENSDSSANVLDGRFSISVGAIQQEGYLISISADNVTGPRVVLVNLTASTAHTLFSRSIQITLDGSPVVQASSVTEVLAVHQGDPPKFVALSSSSGVKLLISIPHFSSHLIRIVPIQSAVAALVADLPIMLISMAAVSAVFALSYSRRPRIAV